MKSLMHGMPAAGLDVFITAWTKKGKKITIPGLANTLGQEIYGASLDPDAEDPYCISESEVGVVEALVEEYDATGEYVHFRIWKNGLKNDMVILQEADTNIGIVLPTGQEHLVLEIPIFPGDIR